MITDEKKEEIREAADLVEVIGDYVRLKRAGKNYVGLCPFHDEKTPSFTVTPALGIYKCFGCGASGDVFNFVMEMEGIGFAESLRTLAERFGVSLPTEKDPEEDEKYKEREGIYHALRFAGLFYFTQLKETEEAAKAREYLEKRGYDGSTIRKFGLGYAPASGEALLNAAKKEGLKEEYLLKADLVKPSNRNDGFYDTFRDRLIFPIFNPSGKVIAFAGRILGNKKAAKYINSAQTPVYNKSEVIYGVNFAKNEIRKQEEVILVEGYTDVITMIQCGVKNVVASSGTALTPQQIRILKRYGDKITMIYDSDSAGQTAMKRGMNIALAGGMEVDLLELPEDEDPDSFLKKYGKISFEELKKKESFDFVSFSVRQAENAGEMDHPSGITKTITRILESVAEIPDPLARQVYVQYLHQKTQKYRNSSDRELFDQLNSIIRQKKKRSRKSSRSEPPPPVPFDTGSPSGEFTSGKDQPASRKSQKRPLYEMELIRLMLLYGSEMIRYIGHLCNDLLFEDDELKRFYRDIMERFQKEEEVSVDHYANREDPYPKLVADIIPERYAPSDRHQERTGSRFERDKKFQTAKSSMKTLKYHYLKRFLVELAEKIKTAELDEKKELIKKQKRAKREFSRLDNLSADELFPDPDDAPDSTPVHKKFEYKMKHERNE